MLRSPWWMRRAAGALPILGGLLSGGSVAQTPSPAATLMATGPVSCEAAISAAEPGSGLPAGLLRAIARAESGRMDPLTRRVAPWPWAINAAGVGAYPETREAAILRVREALARGTTSVDVGCMQINLRHHPTAFATLEEAFDPQVNVAYAIRFINDLKARHGDWSRAIAHYHSADPDRGGDYLRRVNATWAEAPVAPGIATSVTRPADRVVVMSAPAASVVRVFTPTQPSVARMQVVTPAAYHGARPIITAIRMPRRG